MSDDEDIKQRYVPSKRRGWQGEELEMNHKREQNPSSLNSYAAVDITQFQNTEVGKGYQASHVVRQKSNITLSRSTTNRASSIISQENNQNRNGGAHESSLETDKSEKKSKKKRRKDDSKKHDKDISSDTNEYLKCSALREFRKEIERILNDASPG